MTDRKAEIVAECARQEESCLYTSTSLFLWLRHIRFWHRVIIASPIVLGGLAGWGTLATGLPEVAAGIALLAGFFPAIYDALKMKGEAEEVARYAAQFKVLQDRFRQAARITSVGPVDELEADFRELMGRMDSARAVSLTPPQRFFEKARTQIEAGNYKFTVD